VVSTARMAVTRKTVFEADGKDALFLGELSDQYK
jgi:hypothetical protein